MKYLLLIALAQFTALTAKANTPESVYKKDTVLPLILQQEILKIVSANCTQGISQNGLTEQQTTAEANMKQGADMIIYSTIFDSRYLFDGTHPIHSQIEVQSVEILSPAQESDRYQTLRVSGPACQ